MEDYKQKYESALKVALQWHKDGIKDIQLVVECIFPELKESKDERIRKSIIEFLSTPFVKKGMSEGALSTWIAWLEKQGEQKTVSKTEPIIKGLTTEFQKQVSYIIASAMNKEHEYTSDFVKWTANALLNYAKHELEKQGKQKPADKCIGCNNFKGCITCIDGDQYAYTPEQKFTDKVESKFKVGDWIVRNNDTVIHKVVDIRPINDDGKIYGYNLNDFTYFSGPFENEYHLWTIQDAKDGDALATDNGGICIFDGTVEEGKYPFAYCGVTERGFEFYDRKLPFTHADVHPATKEQCNLLFSKMKEAGYEWDSEKKELKKIEQLPAWSEEDENMFDAIIADIQFTQKAHTHDVNQVVYEREIDWLKSLKQRMKGE